MTKKKFLLCVAVIVGLMFATLLLSQPVEPKVEPTPQPVSDVGCNRTQEYPLPEEFRRAISLIVQRLDEGNNSIGNQMVVFFKGIRNCVDIQYAQSDTEINSAEGVFSFSENSTPNQLQILVSPRYKSKDDLLTAILLSHELTHAAIYASGAQESISCYDNESLAHLIEMLFIGTLNDDEIASLTYRANNGYPEAKGVLNLILGVRRSKGADSSEKVANYVRSKPFYQQQCGQ